MFCGQHWSWAAMRTTGENTAPEALGNTAPAAWVKVYRAESRKQTVGLQQKALSNTEGWTTLGNVQQWEIHGISVLTLLFGFNMTW